MTSTLGDCFCLSPGHLDSFRYPPPPSPDMSPRRAVGRLSSPRVPLFLSSQLVTAPSGGQQPGPILPTPPGPLPWAPQPGTQSEHLGRWCSPGWDRLPSCLSHLQPGASRLPAPSGRASTPQNKFQKPRLRAQSQGRAALPSSLPSFAFLFLRCLSFPAGGFVC